MLWRADFVICCTEYSGGLILQSAALESFGGLILPSGALTSVGVRFLGSSAGGAFVELFLAALPVIMCGGLIW